MNEPYVLLSRPVYLVLDYADTECDKMLLIQDALQRGVSKQVDLYMAQRNHKCHKMRRGLKTRQRISKSSNVR